MEDLFGQVGGGVAAPRVAGAPFRRDNGAVVRRRLLDGAARRDLPHAVCDVARRHRELLNSATVVVWWHSSAQGARITQIAVLLASSAV